MSRNWLRLRTALTLAVLLLLGACGAGPVEERRGVGMPLPPSVLTGLAGEATVSTDALRGTSLVINFWATWCSPCRREMPSLERLSRRLAAHGVRVVGVTVDNDLNLAREFVHARGLTFPMYADGEGKPLQSALQVRALPETVLVSPDGTVIARIAGARDWDGVEGVQLVERAFKLRLAAVP